MTETNTISQSPASHYAARPLIESMGHASLLNPHFLLPVREDAEDGCSMPTLGW